jgi:hypothetical protein
MMRISFIVLGFGSAASSLTLTARVSRPAPRQAEEQSGGIQQSSSVAEAKKPARGKIVTIHSEFNAAPRVALRG